MCTRTGVSGFTCIAIALATCLTAAPDARADELSSWAQGIADRPSDPQAYEAYAVAAMTARRWDDAIRALRAGVDRVPQFGRGYYLLALAHRNKGEWAEAAGYYRTCISLKSQVNDARFGLAKALVALGDRVAAIEELRHYIADEHDPLKERFVEAARVDLAALERQQAAAPATPATAASLRADADKLKAAGRLEDAAIGYRRAIEAAPSDALLRNELGTVLFALRRYVEAAEAFAAAAERDGTYAVAWFNLSSALRKAERPAEAVRAGMRYVALLPADPDGWYALGQARDLAHDDHGAADAYKRFIAIESRPAQQKYVEKAKAQLAQLESKQRAGAMGLKPMERDDILPMSDGAHGDLRDPFDAGGARGVDADVESAGSIAVDASGRGGDGGARKGDAAGVARAREYLAALAAYRHALAAHADRVSARCEKGAALAVAGRIKEANAAWDAVPLEDEKLAAARRQLEKLRGKK